MNLFDQFAEVAVLGAGIIGLTTGLRLLGLGLRVVIYAREKTPLTTSDVVDLARSWLAAKSRAAGPA
jgi:glycine/D-amino acid oxidase-like deaminating enzyme